MCETFVATTGEEITNHNCSHYDCPKCGQSWCWECNPADQAGSWHGERACGACGEVIEEGDFS